MTHQKAPTRWDIAGTYLKLAGIYGEANALTTPKDERFVFLVTAAGDLSRCYRKGLELLYPIALAQLSAWYLSVGEALFRASGGHILARAMGDKYPETHCGYCNFSPCQCTEAHRPPHSGGSSSLDQLHWPISRWQAHLSSLYGPANREGGMPRALNRLFEEIAEVGLVLHLADGFNDDLDEVRKKIAREMTDVKAWILAIGSLLGVNVEQAIRSVYGKGCPVCKNVECGCRHFERRPTTGVYTHRFMPAEEIHALLAA